MKFKKSKVAIAALTNKNDTALAVLSFSVGSLDNTQNNRVQLLPSGHFSSKDGRPEDVAGGKWLMDAEAFAILKANAAKRTNDYHFDYEHQTMHTEENGKPAPAAAWFDDFEYIEGEGLYALNVHWTPDGQKAVDDKEYRYTSAVFAYDTKTGRPTNLMHVALTNDPAVDGMKAIAALKAKTNSPNLTNHTTPGEDTMNEAFKLMLGLLGIAHTDDDLSNAVALKKLQDLASTAIAALKTKADKSGQLEKDLNTANQSVVALKAGGAKDVDATKFVPIATYNDVNQQLAALKNGTDENSVEQLLKDNAAKITGQADRDYLESVGKSQGVAALKAMLEPRIAIAALTNTQTNGKEKPADKGGGELSTEQIAMCKNMGLSKEEFQAELAKDAGED
jgi:phage I-like protein